MSPPKKVAKCGQSCAGMTEEEQELCRRSKIRTEIALRQYLVRKKIVSPCFWLKPLVIFYVIAFSTIGLAMEWRYLMDHLEYAVAKVTSESVAEREAD